MKSNHLVIAIILLIPVALVAGPVLSAGMRSEIAHWYLAAAANAIELGKGDVEKAIESARSWDPEVGKLQDYWTVRLRQLETRPDLTLMEVLKEVPTERKAEFGAKLASDLGKRGEFELAAAVLLNLLGDEANKNIIYWDLKISNALIKEGAASAIITLRQAIELNSQNLQFREVLASQYATILADKNEFDSALEAYKILYGEKYARDVITLNTLAYSRALAHVELDEALADIDEALTHQPNEPGMRDTRAWVLYHAGRYEEALVDADFAIKEMERPSLVNWLQNQLESKAVVSPASDASPNNSKAQSGANTSSHDQATQETPNEHPDSPPAGTTAAESQDPSEMTASPESNKVYLTNRLAKPSIWTRGVLRYHHAKILEKLGKTEEARSDWQWLERENLPPDDRLH